MATPVEITGTKGSVPLVEEALVVITRNKMRGHETETDPLRSVTQVWRNGKLIAEHDPCSRVPLGSDPDRMLSLAMNVLRAWSSLSPQESEEMALKILTTLQIIPKGHYDCSGTSPVWVPED